jgi:hypothetical protein
MQIIVYLKLDIQIIRRIYGKGCGTGCRGFGAYGGGFSEEKARQKT